MSERELVLERQGVRRRFVGSSLAVRRYLTGYGLLLPALAVFAVFYYGPALFLAYISFFHWSVLYSASRFVGLDNFRILFAQPLFWKSLLNSVYYTVVMIPATVLVALGLALLLREGLEAKRGGLARALVFLPHVTPVVATSIVWVWIFNPRFGLANYLLHLVGLPALGWLESVKWAFPAVMIDTLWHSVGLYVLIFLAGLANVPRNQLEAARVDGAAAYTVFRRIIWPLLSPTTFFVVILTTVNTWQAFSQIFAMTGGPHGGAGGPAFATTTDALLVYSTAFLYQHFSLAAAMSLVLFGIIFTLALLQKLASDRLVFYR
ncbi:MAG: sugar ABC transporter permease [Thermaerobacter sp.]|nr:sugar ABC transporter permease [Thermaerobacter sp.]